MKPVETSVSPGNVLFQAGWQQGLDRQKSIQRKSLRLWQLATISSMLLATVSIVVQFRTLGDFTDVANSPDESSTAVLPIESQPANQPENYLVGRQRNTGLAPWSLFPVSRDSDIFRRHSILRRGVEGLPEPGFVTLASFGAMTSNRQSLMKDLRLERGIRK